MNVILLFCNVFLYISILKWNCCFPHFVYVFFQEEKAKAYKKEKLKEKKRKAEEDLNFEEDDEMAAVMGFSGFGSSKKGH